MQRTKRAIKQMLDLSLTLKVRIMPVVVLSRVTRKLVVFKITLIKLIKQVLIVLSSFNPWGIFISYYKVVKLY